MGFVWTHVPAMSGDTTGVALCSETGAENITEMVVFGATFWAPEVGLVALSENPVSDEPRDPPEPDRDPPLDAAGDAGCPGGDEQALRSSTSATMPPAPTRSTHGRSRNGLPGLDSRTFMASARSRHHWLGIRRVPA